MALVPAPNPPSADAVSTPRDLAKRIIDRFPLSGTVLDCCRGDGAFYDQYPSSVRKEWCEIEEGRDFFDFVDRVDWIVTNPPWSKHRDFCAHAYRVADEVVFLVTVNHAVALRARNRDAAEAGFGVRAILYVDTPPKPWPQSGFQLAVVWMQRGYRGETFGYL